MRLGECRIKVGIDNCIKPSINSFVGKILTIPNSRFMKHNRRSSISDDWKRLKRALTLAAPKKINVVLIVMLTLVVVGEVCFRVANGSGLLLPGQF